MAYVFGMYQYGKTSNGLSKSENLLKVCTVLATTNDGGQSGWKTGNIFVLLMKMTEKTKHSVFNQSKILNMNAVIL